MKNKILALLLMSVVLTSCKKDDIECDNTLVVNVSDQDQLAKDIGYIDDFLNQNGITAIEHESGLRYVIHKQGNGAIPGICNSVLANYSGHILNRTSVFDKGERVGFGLKNVILGWQVGFTQLQKGDSATLYIPSGLAYGANGSSHIPGDANLVFEVGFIDFQ